MSAHQALISYTAHYPYLYGARGAGVGHFPCPDTDRSVELHEVGWSLQSGPNPPCGRHSTVSGRFPSHISYPNQRYLLTAALGFPIAYEVSSELINNPANRVVNPSVVLNAQRSSSPLLTLEQTTLNRPSSVRRKSNTLITATSLLYATKPAVAAWFVQRVRMHQSLDCLFAVAWELHKPAQSVNLSRASDTARTAKSVSWCDQLHAITNRCHSNTDFSASLWPSYIQLPVQTIHAQEDLEALEQIFILLLADGFPDGENCKDLLSRQWLIEGVPANAHWFFRNQWTQWIRLQIEDTCANESITTCEFVKISQGYKNASPLIIHWGAK